MHISDLDRSRSLSGQIVGQVIAQVEGDSLREGTRLPSVRALANELCVNRNTIAQVYKELAQKGYVVSRFGAGSYVRKPGLPGRAPAAGAAPLGAAVERGHRAGRASRASRALARGATAQPRGATAQPRGATAQPRGATAQPRGATAQPRGANSPVRGADLTVERLNPRDWEQRFAAAVGGFRAQPALAAPGAVINLSALQPYTGLFPIEQFRLCLNTVLRRQGRQLLGYAAPAGYLPLRERIAARLKAQGILVEAAQVLITGGSQQGIDLLARGFLDPGDSVVVESPTYSIALKILQVNRARLIPYPVGREGIRLDALERALGRTAPKLFYAVPNFQNPTTHSYSETEKRELLAWVHRTGGLLVEDASDSELQADYPRRPALAALDSAERVLYLNTFSKTMAPAVRVGYLAGPAPAIRKLTELKEMTDLSHSLILQAATAEFMERGLFDAHSSAVRAFYRERMAAVGDMLERELPEGTPFTRPGGGLCVWVDLPGHVDAESLQRDLAGQGVLVSPGGLYQPGAYQPGAYQPGAYQPEAYQPETGGRNGLRLCVAHEPLDRLSQGIHALGAHLKRVLLRPAALPSLAEYQSIH